MGGKKICDDLLHVHFVTFSCYRRRALLQPHQAKRIVIGHLGACLARRDGLCLGFVIMPNHLHTLIWFPQPKQLSGFLDEWKGQSSQAIKTLYRTQFPGYWQQLDAADSVWQARHYGFNIWSRQKVDEKLDYMHLNPVRAGLTERAVDWKWSSARWYLERKPVGLPIRWPRGLEANDEFVVGS